MKTKLWLLLVVVALCVPLFSARAEVKSKYNVDFYGYVKLDAVFMDAYAIIGDNQLIYVPPGNLCGVTTACNPHEMDNGDRPSFSMTARQTRFGFLVTGPESEGGLITRGRIEADFYGSAPARSAAANNDVEENKGLLMLRRATVEILGKNWEVLAGNEWMVVSPIFPQTNNYPYNAEIGNLGYRTPQIRLTGYMLDKKLIFQLAATNKMGDVDTLDIDTGRLSGAPTWEAGITYKDAFTLGLTGHYGYEEMRTTRHGAFGYYGDRVESWSANLHAIVPLGEMASISGEYYQGANLDGWYTGGQGSGWVVDKDGDREAIESTGGWVQLMVAPAKPIKLYFSYGFDDVNDDQLEYGMIEPGYANKPGNTAITKNWAYNVMADYWVNPATKVSLEWMHLVSEYDLADSSKLDWDNGEVNRYMLSFWYIF
jgi:hypothetical protein